MAYKRGSAAWEKDARSNTAGTGMADDGGPCTPISPAFLLGLALRPCPPAVLAPACRHALAIIHRCHPELHERMCMIGGAAFVIEPTDLPLRFIVRFDSQGPRLRLQRPHERCARVSAIVRGPVTALIALLEARIDGDALFFSRTLSIEGDVEAVVALRNAIENVEIDLMRDLADELGPFRGPARAVAAGLDKLLRIATQDLEKLRAALLAPLEERVTRLAMEIEATKAMVAPRRGALPRHEAARD
ncbi:MAG TPA: SCP2 sterol-binding domain-containing protein [Alphaproteobacteria bacterium]|nr:SCP2 sterol-binding domain-containing protein [Alphaproteobacteria bacterium]